ncbi:hypothetical protein EON82_11310 [bacterium]|nr:MAG: hypothetical protein EON82_11310 [bacterium]
MLYTFTVAFTLLSDVSIFVDLPDPNSIELAKLYSLEFYRKLRRCLSADGVAVVQATSPFHAKETFLCIRRTMAAAGLRTLPYHDNVPSFGDWGWILANAKGEWRGRGEIEVPTSYLTPELIQRSRAFGRDWLTSGFSDVSTLMQPVVLQRYLDAGWKVE